MLQFVAVGFSTIHSANGGRNFNDSAKPVQFCHSAFIANFWLSEIGERSRNITDNICKCTTCQFMYMLFPHHHFNTDKHSLLCMRVCLYANPTYHAVSVSGLEGKFQDFTRRTFAQHYRKQVMRRDHMT